MISRAFLFWCGLLIGAIAPGLIFAAEEKLPVLVYSSVKNEIQKAPHPTPEKPVYYVPVSGGYIRRGAVAADERPVDLDRFWKSLRDALASQGYLPTGKNLPAPALIITFHWGILSPTKLTDDPNADPDDPWSYVILNLKEMSNLTGGNTVDRQMEIEKATAWERASQDRYFVVVTAYDFAAAQNEKDKAKRKKILWRSCMSVPAARNSLGETLGPMVAAGTPYLGRNTDKPEEFKVPKPGRVDVGTPQVIDHPAAPEKK